MKSLVNRLKKFIQSKGLTAKAIIASFAVTSIVYFVRESGVNGLPSAISLYIASGVGIESLGILFSELLNNSKKVTDEDFIEILDQAHRNGDLDAFANNLISRQDLQTETGKLMEKMGILEDVLLDALQDHEDKTVEQILQGVKQYSNIASQKVIDRLGMISLDLSEVATRHHAEEILRELRSVKAEINKQKVPMKEPSNLKPSISDEENKQLNFIIRRLPSIYDTKRRVNFLDSAGLIMFADRIEFEGTPGEFAQQLVRVLYDYGRLPNGQLALYKLVLHILELTKGQKDVTDFLNSLVEKCAMPDNRKDSV